MTLRQPHGKLRREPALSGAGSSRGSTLVEVLVALTLVSVLVLALVNGLLTSSRATTVSNRTQRQEAALTSFGETLKQLPYLTCADASFYQLRYQQKILEEDDPLERARRFGVGGMSSVDVEQVRYWQPGNFGVTPRVGGEFVDDCPTVDGGSQLLTIRVTMGADSRSAEVVKRDGTPASFLAGSPPTTLPGANVNPKASFVITQPPGNTPVTVSVDGSGSRDPDGNLATFTWDFGDGGSGNGAVTSHVYTRPGLFQIVLTVTDDQGSTATSRKAILVPGVPVAPVGLRKTGQGASGLVQWYFDLAWDAVPGVAQYELQLIYRSRWSDPLQVCPDVVSRFDAPASSARVLVNSIGTVCSLIGYDAKIRARVGSSWGPWSTPDVLVRSV